MIIQNTKNKRNFTDRNYKYIKTTKIKIIIRIPDCLLSMIRFLKNVSYSLLTFFKDNIYQIDINSNNNNKRLTNDRQKLLKTCCLPLFT